MHHMPQCLLLIVKAVKQEAIGLSERLDCDAHKSYQIGIRMVNSGVKREVS